MTVDELFTAEWLANFQLSPYTLEQVHAAMHDYVAKCKRINELRAILGERPNPINLAALAQIATPSAIVNHYPNFAANELAKLEQLLAQQRQRSD